MKNVKVNSNSPQHRSIRLIEGIDNAVFLILALLLGLAYLLLPILFPFITAALLAYLSSSIVSRLEKIRFFSRSLAVSAVFMAIVFLISGLFLLILPLIEQQVSLLLQKIPEVILWLKITALPWLKGNFSVFSQLDTEKLQQGLKDNIGSASGLLVSVFGSISASGVSFLNGVATFVLTPVLMFYFLRDWKPLLAKIHNAFPRSMEKKVAILALEVDEVLSAFFKGQIMVMLCLAAIYSIGLSIAGLEFAILIGLIAGVVSFVPYLGLITGLVLGCLAAFFQLHDMSLIVPVLVVFGLGQLLESIVLTPLLVGDRIGLHPVAVIFSVMAGGQLFGFTGILLALPIAAVLLVFIKYFGQRYKKSSWYLET